MLNPNFRDMLSALLAAKAEFLIVGAYAVAAHGLPRATQDIDIWVRPSSDNARRVYEALAAFGAPMENVELADLANPKLILQIGVPPQRIDILTAIEGVDFDEAWAARATVELDHVALPTLSREHLIRNKQAVDRPQDRADVSRLQQKDKRK